MQIGTKTTFEGALFKFHCLNPQNKPLYSLVQLVHQFPDNESDVKVVSQCIGQCVGGYYTWGILCVCVHVCEKTEQEGGVFEMAKCDWSVPCWATNYAEIGYNTIRLFHIHHFSLYVKCGKLFWWSFKEIFGETQKAKVRKNSVCCCHVCVFARRLLERNSSRKP